MKKLKIFILALAILAGASTTATKAKACPVIGAGENDNDTYFLVYQCVNQSPYEEPASWLRWNIYVTLGL